MKNLFDLLYRYKFELEYDQNKLENTEIKDAQHKEKIQSELKSVEDKLYMVEGIINAALKAK